MKDSALGAECDDDDCGMHVVWHVSFFFFNLLTYFFNFLTRI